MTDMMIKDVPTGELDNPVVDAKTTNEVEAVADDLASNDDLVDNPVADAKTTNEVEAVADDLASNDDLADDPIADVKTTNEVEAVADDLVSDDGDDSESLVSEEKATPIVESSSKAEVATTKPTPVTKPTSKTEAPVAVTSDSDGDEDSYHPSLALRVFTIARDSFIWLFELILTGVAIVIEFIVGLDWAGYRERVGEGLSAIHNFIPEQHRKVIYGGLIAIAILIPVGIGAFAFLNNDPATNDSNAQTVNVSQNPAPIVDNGILSPVFTPTVQQWASDIAVWTAGTGISPDMFAIVMQLESCGNSAVMGGLFGLDDASNTLSESDAQAQTALDKLQSAMLTTNGDFEMALAVYADGERVLTDDFALWSAHGRDMFILGRNIHSQAQQGYTSSPDLNSWLQNTGSILCTQAQATRSN